MVPMSRIGAKKRPAGLRGLAASGALFLACSAGEAPVPPQTSSVRQSVVAPDGDLTIAGGSSMFVNRYAALTADAAKGAQTVQVGAAGAAVLALATGDLVLIYQLQGATISSADDGSFGSVTDPGGAGLYELASVSSVNLVTGEITLGGGCAGLRNGYTAAGKTQVIRVPQYNNVTVEGGETPGFLVGRPWNGTVGGVLVLRAAGVVKIDGVARTDGQGFNGGATDVLSQPTFSTDQPTFRTTDGTPGAEKGEGIAGYQAAYDAAAIGGRYGRGAAANGGGGGNATNAGGGGGANGGALAQWNGQGVMNDQGKADIKTAWGLDPWVSDATKGSGKLATSSGGGRGGYTYSASALDVKTVPPGDASWGGSQRRERGGWGGRPVVNDPSSRLFLGGGGGAGEQNDNLGGAGGRGGGLVLILAGRIEGAGRITANGVSGGDSTGDGAGGGGAGGTVVLAAPVVTGVTVEAKGGAGGSGGDSGSAVFGPGGAGGGGFVALPLGSSVTPVVSGGAAGTSASTAAAVFPGSGASDGGSGEVVKTLGTQQAALPACQQTDLAITVTDNTETAQPGQTLTYQIVVTNKGPLEVTAAPVLGQLAPVQAEVSWSCTAAGQAEGDVAQCAAQSGSGNVATAVSLSPGAKATIAVTVKVAQGTSGPLEYTAVATPPFYISDPVLGNNTGRDQTQIGAAADVSLVYTTTPDLVGVNAPVTFRLVASNAGPSAASNVQVSLDVPAGLTVSTEPSGDGWSCTRSGVQYTCARDAIEAGGSAPVLTFVGVADGTSKQIVASATAATGSADPNPGNNGASAFLTVDPSLPGGGNGNVLSGGGLGCSAVPGGAAAAPGPLGLLALAGLRLGRRRRTAAGS